MTSDERLAGLRKIAQAMAEGERLAGLRKIAKAMAEAERLAGLRKIAKAMAEAERLAGLRKIALAMAQLQSDDGWWPGGDIEKKAKEALCIGENSKAYTKYQVCYRMVEKFTEEGENLVCSDSTIKAVCTEIDSVVPSEVTSVVTSLCNKEGGTVCNDLVSKISASDKAKLVAKELSPSNLCADVGITNPC